MNLRTRFSTWLKRRQQAQRGSIMVGMGVVGLFVAGVILYNLVPEFITSNQVIQTNTAAHGLTKLGANLGEWMLTLGGFAGLGYAAFRLFSGNK